MKKLQVLITKQRNKPGRQHTTMQLHHRDAPHNRARSVRPNDQVCLQQWQIWGAIAPSAPGSYAYGGIGDSST